MAKKLPAYECAWYFLAAAFYVFCLSTRSTTLAPVWHSFCFSYSSESMPQEIGLPELAGGGCGASDSEKQQRTGREDAMADFNRILRYSSEGSNLIPIHRLDEYFRHSFS